MLSKRIGKFSFQLLFGLIILTFLTYVISKQDFSLFLEKASTMWPIILLLLFIHIVLQILFSSYNIKIIANSLNHQIPYKNIFLSYIPVWSLGKILPGGVGELSILYQLKQEGLDTGNAVFIAFFDKLLTIVTQAIIIIAGIWIFIPPESSLLIIAILVIGIAAMIIAITSATLRNMIKKYILRSYSSKFVGFSSHFQYLWKEKKKVILWNMIITFCKSFSVAAIVTILFFILGTEVNIFSVLVINTLTLVVAMIPITIGGLGTKEAAAVYLYSTIGVRAVIVYAVYVSIRIASLTIGPLASLFVIYYIKNKIKKTNQSR